MSFTSFSTISSSSIGISNSSKKNIVIPFSYIKYVNVEYVSTFVFGSGNFVWNSILPAQRYTNSRTIGSVSRLTGLNAWLNGTYTWSTNAISVVNTLGFLTEGDNSISWVYRYPSSDPINIDIKLPLTVRIVLKGVNIKSSSIGSGVTITVDGSNDNGETFDTDIASFVTTSGITGGENLVCSDTLQYSMIRFKIPYLTTTTNFYLHTLNPIMDVYYIPSLDVLDKFYNFPTNLPTISWDASSSISKNTFTINSGIYAGNYEVMSSSAINLPRYAFDASGTGSLRVFSNELTYYEKRDTSFWYAFTNNSNAFTGDVPTIQTQFVASCYRPSGVFNTASIFKWDGSTPFPGNLVTQSPYTSISTNYSYSTSSDASLQEIQTYRGFGDASWFFTTDYTNSGVSMTASGEWIQVKFPTPLLPSEIRFNCYNNGTITTILLPLNTILLGSNDGVNWEFISNCIFRLLPVNNFNDLRNTTTDNPRFQTFINTTSRYTHFRLVVLSVTANLAIPSSGNDVNNLCLAFSSMRIYGTLYSN